jgi:hypothetical protein
MDEARRRLASPATVRLSGLRADPMVLDVPVHEFLNARPYRRPWLVPRPLAE